MKKLWNRGDFVVQRGIIHNRVWSARSVIVVKDDDKETILLLLPGAQCAYTEGYFRWVKGDFSLGTRWQETQRNTWKLRCTEWTTTRVLMFLEPQTYYAIFYMWDHSTDQFKNYYVNFQLPYQRSVCGFDCLDLDLDLVVDPQFTRRWKDEEDFLRGIQEGGIRHEWVDGIEQAKAKVFEKIQSHRYPFDGSWLHWRPDPLGEAPQFHEQWQEISAI